MAYDFNEARREWLDCVAEMETGAPSRAAVDGVEDLVGILQENMQRLLPQSSAVLEQAVANEKKRLAALGRVVNNQYRLKYRRDKCATDVRRELKDMREQLLRQGEEIEALTHELTNNAIEQTTVKVMCTDVTDLIRSREWHGVAERLRHIWPYMEKWQQPTGGEGDEVVA